ncbi:MAG: hypothetical protein M1819_001421 [Sarea resinae]|nr:MAG: hypothetical protein M1819_001421 [Sarea resinae]
MAIRGVTVLLLLVAVLLILPAPAAAFGAGNIASVSKIEGHNWRHGDIEDMLKTIAFLKGRKWTSMMVKRVYFGNWLRDYSQAVDVGTLKGVQAGTIRILVWVLAFLSFGYATEEFEVTDERLGVYRPEEHIDNPRDYADNVDARQYDARLRPPIMPEELAIDPNTGMKNYIANESGGWATSSGYIKHSFARSIHFGRVYTSGARGTSGKEADLCEALRCLGQGLHTMEDFGAHSNYTELALRELGFTTVFPHTGAATEINLRGHRVFPIVTGTFGGVDFLHSVIGEASDHFAQTEVDELDMALGDAQAKTQGNSAATGARGPGQEAQFFTSMLSKVPGTRGLCDEATRLQADADAQDASNQRAAQDDYYAASRASGQPPTFAAPPGSEGGPPGPGIPGLSPDFDPMKTAAQIYPILQFRDRVVRTINGIIEKIPGLEALVERITETLTLFVLSLLAPYIRPIIKAVSNQLKTGSGTIVDASGKHQFEPWTDPHCTDPTHSLLSKDHFSNILNEPAGQVAATTLQYVAPRIVYAWEHPDVPVQQVLDDVVRAFHHPAIRDPHCEIQQKMFAVVQQWVQDRQDRGAALRDLLSSDGVKAGRNHVAGAAAADQAHAHTHSHGAGVSGLAGQAQAHMHGALPESITGRLPASFSSGFGGGGASSSHSKVSGSPWSSLLKIKDEVLGGGGFSSGGGRRDIDDDEDGPFDASGHEPGGYYSPHQQQQQQQQQSPYPPYPSSSPSSPYQQYPSQHQAAPPPPSTSPYQPTSPAPPYGYPPAQPQPQYGYGYGYGQAPEQGQGQAGYPYDQPPPPPPPNQQHGHYGDGYESQGGYGGYGGGSRSGW